MTILVAYATTEGQTRKIARAVATRLTARGHSVELLNVHEAGEEEIAAYDGAILAASVHVGRFQKEIEAFANRHAAALNALPTMFLAVSLAAAGEDPDDWKGLEKIVDDFREKTGFTPGRTEHVAGAFRFTEYDFFKSWAMRWIASQKGVRVDPGVDTEMTDWSALDAAVDAWAAALR